MTETEAVNGAADRHEFRKFTHFTAHAGIYADCWCGWQSAKYATEPSARNAHQRHQTNEAIQRSFEPRRHR